MGIVTVSFRADRELEILEAFAAVLPNFQDATSRAMTQRYRTFEGGALEYVGRGGVYAVLCQSVVDGEDAIVSTLALVDAEALDAMTRGEGLRPAVSFSSYVGTSYPGIQAILTAIGGAVERRLAEHAENPALNADFDWCVAIERRQGRRARAFADTAQEMTTALTEVAGHRRAA
jgi:hypothetical protein